MTMNRESRGKDVLVLILTETLAECRSSGRLSGSEVPAITLETPKHEGQGDFATTLALSLAKIEKKNPRKIAQILVSSLENKIGSLDNPFAWIEKIEIAGPGYINFFLSADYWLRTLLDIHDQQADFGHKQSSTALKTQKIQIEFVSANPTGPLHVASGRAAALGDALARLLEAVGHEVDREYYLNDVGAQMSLLGRSTYLRYREFFGETITLPEGSYQGQYVIEIAEAIQKSDGDQYLQGDENDHLPFFTRYSFDTIVSWIKKDISDFGIDFESWFSEKTLHEKKGGAGLSEVSGALALLKSKNMLYEKESASWIATTQFGDDKDRVVVRRNGALTYFASDIAYHRNKFERGYDRLIDIWGADHHGYVPRVKAAALAMGYQPERLTVLIHQLVNLLRDGKAVKMSKRAGSFVRLREVMDEVGVDATRFFFLMRRADTTLDFDLELAKKASSENPVYYVQYAYARLCSIDRVAKAQDWQLDRVIREIKIKDLTLLSLPEEQNLLKQLAQYPELIQSAAEALEPHRLTFYLQTLSGMVHRYYFNCRIITDDQAQTKARLVLVSAIRIVLKNGLDILGISAPEQM